jgi:hypothetical protein
LGSNGEFIFGTTLTYCGEWMWLGCMDMGPNKQIHHLPPGVSGFFGTISLFLGIALYLRNMIFADLEKGGKLQQDSPVISWDSRATLPSSPHHLPKSFWVPCSKTT